MAADLTNKSAGSQPAAEAYLMINPEDWNGRLAIPARLASVILPEMIHMQEEYKDGAHVQTITGKQIEIKLIDAANMAAIRMAARLEGKT